MASVSRLLWYTLSLSLDKGAPMTAFDRLLQLAGPWRGSYRLQPMPTDPISESTSQLIVTPLLRDTFVRFDQQWSWKGEPQSGSLLIGYAPKSPKTHAASIHWIDTWHNGTTVMPLTGEFAADGALIARGHFAVNDSPDWGWRIEIRADDARLKIDMFCVNPGSGKDEGGVWSEYERE